MSEELDDQTTVTRRTPPAVAVVDAQTPGNVGTIARGMKNFGFEDLLLVDPPALDRDGPAYGFAGHARDDILPNASEVTFDQLVENYHTIGCTAVTNEDDNSHVRFPFSTPGELADRLETVEGPTALVFGRERVGLTNEELAQIDEICSIPAAEEYPVLNLGQAATITLYELSSLTLAKGDTQLPDREQVRAPQETVDRVYDQWDALLAELNHPSEKHDKTMRMLRRIHGRADLTAREAHTLLGVLRRATDRPEKK
ncbi:RNA methyltransferase [Natronorubrum daqingense]|uniref:RNA methyltransferase n=1 Tax=Natronorubrum daqingense TaxID=588898 RepID=A0A1N6X6Z3_9EURY|nr:RNA methyltransferase [Natronorubrum daqingense]APX96029.1 RNA methyltransferase [Natronorubrum daqingense]SIQ98096.1 RNA methyltransferase, TrmH family, group 1 [Natronorubrum daqingense]